MWENVSKPKNPKMERMGRKMVQIIWENFREKNKAKNGKKFARSFATPYCEVMISMRWISKRKNSKNEKNERKGWVQKKGGSKKFCEELRHPLLLSSVKQAQYGSTSTSSSTLSSPVD